MRDQTIWPPTSTANDILTQTYDADRPLTNDQLAPFLRLIFRLVADNIRANGEISSPSSNRELEPSNPLDRHVCLSGTS